MDGVSIENPIPPRKGANASRIIRSKSWPLIVLLCGNPVQVLSGTSALNPDMTEPALQEIRGFVSMSEYGRFVRFIDEHVAAGKLRDTEGDPTYGAGAVYGGRWVADPATGETWRLVPPEFPFRGLFERVRQPRATPEQTLGNR